MNIGPMKWSITIQRQEQTGTSEYNEPIYSWVDRGTYWAQKIAKREDEAVSAEQEYAVRIVTFRTHWIEDLAETDQIICDGRTYAVKGITELGFRAGMDISAKWVS